MRKELAGPERLRVYHLALDLGAAVDVVARGKVRRDPLAMQLARAVDSVILNIAEGAAFDSPGRKLYHYQTAHASGAECIAAITRMLQRGRTPALVHARRSANMVCVMLTALIHAQEKRRNE